MAAVRLAGGLAREAGDAAADAGGPATGERPVDALLAVGCGLAALAVYVASLPPSFAFWDTGELQTVAAILGIAHPPACPAFVLLGWAFVHLIPFREPAWRVDLMCASAVATSVTVAYLIARYFGVGRATAVVCALGFAFASVPWRDATRAEVQDVALLFRVSAFYLALVYARNGSPGAFVATAFATGLAGATHGITVLLLPGIALVILTRGLPRLRLVLFGFAALAVGLAPYGYLPLRSAWIASHHLDPTVGIGLPPGLPFWNYDDPHTWHNFVRVISGADFDVHSGFAGFVDPSSYGRFGAALVLHLGGAFGYVGCILAAIGAGAFAARRNLCGVALVLVALLPVPYTESYNELQDPDRYYLFSLCCASIAIGAGFELVIGLFALRAKSIVRVAFLGGIAASFVAAYPERGVLFAQSGDYGAPLYVDEIKSMTPDNAIVLAEWAYSSPLAYAAYVDHSFGDRIVVASGPDQYTTHIAGWLASRPVYFVSFSDALAIPGFRADMLKDGPYYFYAIKRGSR
jgi:hypothetical protein